MIECPSCGRGNTLDGKFCHSCGAELPEADLLQKLVENAEFVAEGRRMLESGRVEEARMVAETALQADPNSAAALTLLGECLEEQKLPDEALVCYERLLEMNPQSALDRIKVMHLRKVIASNSRPTPKRRNWIALVAACSAMALVGTVGAIWLLTRGSGDEAQSPRYATLGSIPSAQPFDPPPASGDARGTGESDAQPRDTSNPQQTPDTPAAQPRREPPPITGPALSGSLPDVTPNGARVNLDAPPRLEVKPISPDLPNQLPASPNGRDTDPRPEPGPTSTEPPAIVDIRPSHPPGAGPTAGSEPIPRDPNEANVLIRVARQHFLTGDYAKAADAYSKALAAGADPGPTNQRLAQCLDKMGQRAAAASAYERAIRAYEAAIGSGKGDTAKLKAALDACRQAAKLAQGG